VRTQEDKDRNSKNGYNENALGNIELFKKSYETLTYAGKIVINDFLVNNELSGPRFSLLFRVMMLVMNPKAGVYRFKEYKNWLSEVGFKEINIYHPIPNTYEDVAIIMGNK